MGMPSQDRNHDSDDEEHDECDRVDTPEILCAIQSREV